MDRRNFLAASAGSMASLAVGAPSTPPSDTSADTATAVDLDVYVTAVDDGMKRIGAWKLADTGPGVVRGVDNVDRRVRESLQAMFMVGMLGDLPLQQQTDSRMQSRVQAAAPLMDRAVDEMEQYLESRTPEEFEQAAQLLRKPAALQKILQGLDEQAAQTSVSPVRRKQFRQMIETVAWRMSRQPPSLLVDEVLGKVERAGRVDVDKTSRSRELAARASEEWFWRAGATESPDDPRSPAQIRQSKGLKTLGIGVLVLAGSGALVAMGAVPFVFGMTVGVVMMLVGLIMMLTSLALSKTPVAATTGSSRTR